MSPRHPASLARYPPSRFGVNRMAAGEGWSELRAELPRMAAELPPGLVSVDVPTAPDTHPGASATRATAPELGGGDAALGRALAALWRDGAVVLRNAVSAAVCDGLLADMAPYLDAAGRHESTDALVDSRRPDAVVARSAQVQGRGYSKGRRTGWRRFRQ